MVKFNRKKTYIISGCCQIHKPNIEGRIKYKTKQKNKIINKFEKPQYLKIILLKINLRLQIIINQIMEKKKYIFEFSNKINIYKNFNLLDIISIKKIKLYKILNLRFKYIIE